MAAPAHVLAHAEQAFMFPEVPKRGGLTLVDRLDDISTILETLDSLADDEHSPQYREVLELQLTLAISGTREKVDRTSAVLGALQAASEGADCEIARLAQRKKRLEGAADRLTDYVLATLAASGMKKLDGHTSTLAARNNPPSVRIAEGATVPGEYLRQPPPPPPVPDKTALKLAIQAGAEIAGVFVVQTQRLVRS